VVKAELKEDVACRKVLTCIDVMEIKIVAKYLFTTRRN
jgi:hypothetical protein